MQEEKSNIDARAEEDCKKIVEVLLSYPPEIQNMMIKQVLSSITAERIRVMDNMKFELDHLHLMFNDLHEIRNAGTPVPG